MAKDSQSPERLRIAPAANGSWDFAEAQNKVRALREKYPSLENLILLAEGEVEYGASVNAADRMRTILPIVLGTGEDS